MASTNEIKLKLTIVCKAEINSSIVKKFGKDTDLIYEGSYAQLEQTSRTPTSIDTALNSMQADLIIIELKNKLQRTPRVVGKIKKGIVSNTRIRE